MNPHNIRRRDWCKGLFAFGSLTVGGAAARAEQQAVGPAGQDQRRDAALKRGATIEEIAKLAEPLPKNAQEAIRALKAGNARFFSGAARRPELSAMERRAQILGQTPFAVVLSCSDSRVPTEIVLDQGLGTLFITRVAGNVVDRSTLGSIEYGIEHLKTHLVVVMGHEGCGAVRAALLPREKRARETENIQFLLEKIVPAVEKLPNIRDDKARMREAVLANVRQQVHNLRAVEFIRHAGISTNLAVIGAYYEISSGAVDFLETEEDLRVAAEGGTSAAWRAHLA